MKGELTTLVVLEHKELPERQHHFPRTYLRQLEKYVGGWIIYYEPRRSSGNQAGGRQAYFATALLTSVRPDLDRPDHFYADHQGYSEFQQAVPFRESKAYYETILRQPCGGTSQGAFGRSVRGVPSDKYWITRQAGIASDTYDKEHDTLIARPSPRAEELGKHQISMKGRLRAIG